MYHDVLLLGIVVSLLYTELTGLSPAGLIVPGYLVLCLQSPYRVAYTAVIVLLTLLAAKLLNRWVILYGRRQFAVMVLLSAVLHLGLSSLQGGQTPDVIGTLIPGIVANECSRQGIVKSLCSLAIVTGVLALLLLWNNVGVLPL